MLLPLFLPLLISQATGPLMQLDVPKPTLTAQAPFMKPSSTRGQKLSAQNRLKLCAIPSQKPYFIPSKKLSAKVSQKAFFKPSPWSSAKLSQ